MTQICRRNILWVAIDSHMGVEEGEEEKKHHHTTIAYKMYKSTQVKKAKGENMFLAFIAKTG